MVNVGIQGLKILLDSFVEFEMSKSGGIEQDFAAADQRAMEQNLPLRRVTSNINKTSEPLRLSPNHGVIGNQWSLYEVGGCTYNFRRLTARQSRELTENTRSVSNGCTRSARDAPHNPLNFYSTSLIRVWS
jgi:hypothetical protein